MSSKRVKKPINVEIGNRVLEYQLKGNKSDSYMTSLCGLEYESSYQRCLSGFTGFDVAKFKAMHTELGWDLNYIIAGDSKKNPTKKAADLEYTIEGFEKFFLEATPEAQEKMRAVVLEDYLKKIKKKN